MEKQPGLSGLLLRLPMTIGATVFFKAGKHLSVWAERLRQASKAAIFRSSWPTLVRQASPPCRSWRGTILTLSYSGSTRTAILIRQRRQAPAISEVWCLRPRAAFGIAVMAPDFDP